MSAQQKTPKPPTPQITLIYDKKEHKGLQGSYCWDGICVDYARPSARTDYPEKIAIKKGATLTFKTTPEDKSMNLHATIFANDQIILHEPIDKQMKIHIPKGTYFLNIKASLNGKGDASNIFHIEIT